MDNILITLCIVFLVLKLTDVVRWSWIWVFSPIWLPFAVGLVLVMLAKLSAVLGWG